MKRVPSQEHGHIWRSELFCCSYRWHWQRAVRGTCALSAPLTLNVSQQVDWRPFRVRMEIMLHLAERFGVWLKFVSPQSGQERGWFALQRMPALSRVMDPGRESRRRKERRGINFKRRIDGSRTSLSLLSRLMSCYSLRRKTAIVRIPFLHFIATLSPPTAFK